MGARRGALAIDGNSLAYRAFYATLAQLPYFERHGTPPNNAIKLMLVMALKILKKTDPAYAFVAFDGPERTFRGERYEAYKAGRKKTPEALISQLEPLREGLGLCGFNVQVAHGVEADDLVGSFASLASANGVPCAVYSSDRDLLQLVDGRVSVHAPKRGVSEIEVYAPATFASLTGGLRPEQVPDYKGIVGDASDNLPGVKGIGPATGLALLARYGSLDGVYAHLGELSPRHRGLFEQQRDQAYACRELATIRRDALGNAGLDAFLRRPLADKALFAFFAKWRIGGMERHVYAQQTLFGDAED